MKKIALLLAALALTACGTTPSEPLSWKKEREDYQAQVEMHKCRAAKKQGKVNDCSAEIKAAWASNQTKSTWKYGDIGGVGYQAVK